MAKLGTTKRPAIVHVQNEERLQEVAMIFKDHGWYFIGGVEPDKPEDVSDLEKLLHPSTSTEAAVKAPAQPGRNDPCPCGSGKKYKKCCAGK